MHRLFLLLTLVAAAASKPQDAPKYVLETVEAIPRLILGESPHWDQETELLYLVDIPGRLLLIYDPAQDKASIASVTGVGATSFLIPIAGQSGSFLVGTDLSVSQIDWNGDDGVTLEAAALASTRLEPRPGSRVNDGKCDPSGRLWTGSISPLGNDETEKDMYIYSLEWDCGANTWFLRVREDEAILSNGFAWNADVTEMYHADSTKKSVDAFTFDLNTGDIRDRRTILNLVDEGIPGWVDGIEIDSEGMVWVAIYSGGRLVRVNPVTATIDMEIPIPGVSDVSSCGFAGPNLDILYVTTASREEEPDSGKLFKITDLGITGLRQPVRCNLNPPTV